MRAAHTHVYVLRFRATTNRKLRETVALELSFVNSNLQLLKEQLAELNSSVELYQNVDRSVRLSFSVRFQR